MRIMKGNMESPTLPLPSTAMDGAVQRPENDVQAVRHPETRDWYVDSGAQRLAQASDVSYDDYAQRARELCALPATFEDDRVQIELDLDRILPSLQEFLLGGAIEQSEDQDMATVESAEYGALVAKLRSVLMAYSVRNARVGYVQGHADLLCFVLAHTPTPQNEEQAFWIYATILERNLPEDFFARTPKLHGFHIDVKVFEELMTQRLVPHVPQLAKVDLAFVASLLACKWFIPVWVGELPQSLLVELWEAMLCESDGTFLHLMLALHFVRIACDALASKATDPWDASYVYNEVLHASRGLAPTVSLASIRQQAHAVYSLSDEGVEDWRAKLRGQAPFLASETRALLHTVHFQPTEIARLHSEFMFARTYLKSCERLRLRGLRAEFVDGLLAREFSKLPPELSRRIVDLLRRDVYGNISFYRLAQLLSVLHRGNQEERAMLLFSAADKRHCLCLDRTGIEELADLLCGLAIHQVIQGSVDAPTTHIDWVSQLHRLRRPEHSPLLRAHFLSLLGSMQDNSLEVLPHDVWLERVSNCPDICALITEWESSQSGDRKRHRTQSSGVAAQLRRSGSSSALMNLAQSVSLTRPARDKPVRKSKRGVSPSSLEKERSKSTDDPTISARHPTGSPQLSLLSGHMKNKYMTQRTMQQDARHHSSMEGYSVSESSAELCSRSSDRVFWCECNVS